MSSPRSQTGNMMEMKERLAPYWRSSRSTVSHASTCRSRDIILIAAYRRLEGHTISTAPHCANSQRDAISRLTPDEILRDRLVFGIRDTHVRGCLLRESGLTLKRTDEVCHAAETMTL